VNANAPFSFPGNAMANRLTSEPITESEHLFCGCGRYIPEAQVEYCDECDGTVTRVCADCVTIERVEGYEDWRLCPVCVKARAEMAMRQADHDQWKQIANAMLATAALGPCGMGGFSERMKMAADGVVLAALAKGGV
jgi:hypothetical protein